MKYGYAHTSTDDQASVLHLAALQPHIYEARD
jgi:hypothetical protein